MPNKTSKLFEINKNHDLIRKMNANFKELGENDVLKDSILNLFDFICIVEGESLGDLPGFADRSSKILETLI